MSRNRVAARALLSAAAFVLAGLSAQPAFAEAVKCGDVQSQLVERKSIVDRLQTLSKKKMDPKVACSAFGQLVTNGTSLVKWIDANKEWCQVPDAFAEGLKADHGRAQAMKTKACAVAVQMDQMEKKAKQQAGSGGGGMLGGNGLEGQYRMPQGAL